MNTEGQEHDGKRKIKWATMIPLIGGSAIGCKKATGVYPQFHLSYSAFKKNETHLKRHWPEVPFHYLDENSQMFDYAREQIDFVNSVCPCAGLSMLNVSKKGQSARGSDAVQNDWMLGSAEFVLSNIRPKCYWGENAPGLFDSPGKDLVDKLKDIGLKYGYSFSLVKTNSELHGLPQRRMRTFYFFWNTPNVPLLEWKDTKAPNLVDHLKTIPKYATFQDVYVHDGRASQRFRPYEYVLKREQMSHAQFYKKNGRGTVAKYLERNNLLDDCINWLKVFHPYETFSVSGGRSRTHIDVLEHMKRKLSQGLGYWDDSVKFMGNAFTAVISKNIEYAVHPEEDRFFSIRELLHLMGMPSDFEIDDKKNMNHICQNVPVNTAKDWAEEVVKFCRGEAEMTRFTFLKQDNVTKGITETYPPRSTEEIRGSYKRKALTVKTEPVFIKNELDVYIKEEQDLDYDNGPRNSAFLQNVPSVTYYDKPIRFNQPRSPTEMPVKSEEPDNKNVLLHRRLSELPDNLTVQNVPKAEEKVIIEHFQPTISPTIDTRPLKKRIIRDSKVADAIHNPVYPEDSGVADKIHNPVYPEMRIKMEDKAKQEFRCGVCDYRCCTKYDMEDHWKTSCALTNSPAEAGKIYSCGQCKVKVATVEEMKIHWKQKCTYYARQGISGRRPSSEPVQKLKIPELLRNINDLINHGTVHGSRSIC